MSSNNNNKPLVSAGSTMASHDFTIYDSGSSAVSSASSGRLKNSMGHEKRDDSVVQRRPMPLTTTNVINQRPSHDIRSSYQYKPSGDTRLENATALAQQYLVRKENQPPKLSINATGKEVDSQLAALLSSQRLEEQIGSSSTQPRSETVNDSRVPQHLVETESELTHLRRQLAVANSKIARMDEELSQTRITQHTIDQALGSPLTSGNQVPDFNEQLLLCRDNSLSRSSTHRSSEDETRYFHPVTYPPFGHVRDPWNSSLQSRPSSSLYARHLPSHPMQDIGWNAGMAAKWNRNESLQGDSNFSGPNAPQPQRPSQLRVDDFEDTVRGLGLNRHVPPATRSGPPHVPLFNGHPEAPTPVGWPPYIPTSSSAFQSSTAPVFNQTPHHGQAAAASRLIPTTLSPTAIEFTAAGQYGMSHPPPPQLPWNHVGSTEHHPNHAYMHATEPMNYRRLLDKNVSCNWKYIVDKIVCSNDQQASIFLQQKLKIATAEQKYEIVDAIIAQAYPLMINRFGNFLVQRCFEHGTQDQVIAIANAIRGNTLNLSMDAFGCHVIQKAFDVVPEDYKAIMVHELLRRIPETVVHRYACHVWQKLFELRWSDSPPQIMKYVNEALQGMWHEVALGETGSLVVQNIFENCLEEDKRPCINEVLASIDVIAHGQFGNWCIQHVCEHGAPADKSRAIEHVLHFATEYSTDQFASKVVEKCLKVGAADFLDRYLERVCEGRPDRPRMPLVDIAGDQYGNYLIQYILLNADTQHKELVSQHIRKHMVSLRGSKFGSRVALLCGNPNALNPRSASARFHPHFYGPQRASNAPMGGSLPGGALNTNAGGRPVFR